MPQFRLWVWRFKATLFADRVVRHKVVETTVMGRGAVLVLSAFMAVVAGVQFASQSASKVMETYGGHTASLLWATALMLSSILIWSARMFQQYPHIALILEIPGTLLLALGLVIYGFAVWQSGGFSGSTFAILLTWSSATNLIGRAYMLLVRSRSTWIVDRQLKGLL